MLPGMTVRRLKPEAIPLSMQLQQLPCAELDVVAPAVNEDDIASENLGVVNEVDRSLIFCHYMCL